MRLSEHQRGFLRDLIRWKGAATTRELGPQTSQKDNAARQFCKRRGYVTYDGHYWRITDEGRTALVFDEGCTP